MTFEENSKTRSIYEARLQETFEMMDVDGNGFLSISEVKDVVSIVCSDTPDEEIESLIEDADVNKDGQISYCGKLH